MVELPIATRAMKDETGRYRRFYYKLIIDQIETDAFVCEAYGVIVYETDGDCVTIPNITVSADRIDELLSMLVEHSVGPVGTPDVVADWL